MGQLIQRLGVVLAGVGVWLLMIVDELPTSSWHTLDALASSAGRGIWALLAVTVVFLAPGGIVFLGGSLLRIRAGHSSERGSGGQLLRVSLTMVLAVLTVWFSFFLMAEMRIWDGRAFYELCDEPNFCIL